MQELTSTKVLFVININISASVNLPCLLLIQPSLLCEMRICEIPKCSLSEGLYNCLVLLVARFFEQSDMFYLHWIRRHHEFICWCRR